MIKSFKCKETEKLFYGRFSAKLPQTIQRAAVMKLKVLNAASLLETLRVPPSNHLEALRGASRRQRRSVQYPHQQTVVNLFRMAGQ